MLVRHIDYSRVAILSQQLNFGLVKRARMYTYLSRATEILDGSKLTANNQLVDFELCASAQNSQI
jgi:hypothetical protein